MLVNVPARDPNRDRHTRTEAYRELVPDRLASYGYDLHPHNRARDPHGLYFAGGTIHPGGGLPMVMLSGKLAAQMVLEDLS